MESVMSLESSHPVPSLDQPLLLMDVHHDGDAATVRMTISGEVDDLSAIQLEKAFIGAVRRHRPAVVEMNVRDVTFLDSAGIRALVLCQADARQVDCRITLLDAPPVFRRVLEICGLLHHFHLEPSEVPEPMPACPAVS
jgi:anti-anti-sigma factor